MPLSIEGAAAQLGFAPEVARRSPAMRDLLTSLSALARDGRRVLLHGPSGAGKECLSRFYAAEAIRSGHLGGGMRFVAVNCACLGTLAQSELFGHVEGAATDVRRARPGALELAAAGLLFLDEVGDIPEAAQPLLLRALDPTSGSARRVGAVDDYSTTNVTVIAATNRPLESLREDLLARLGHVLEVPGLDQRGEEIGPVIRQFIARALSERRDLPGSWLDDPPVLERLVDGLTRHLTRYAAVQTWPGNFRGLRTCVEFAASVAPLDSDHTDPEGGFALAVAEAFRRRSGGTPVELELELDDSRVGSADDDAERWYLDFLIEKLRGVDHDQHRALARLLATRDGEITRADVERVTGLKNRTALKRLQLLKEHGLVEALDGGRYRACPPPTVDRDAVIEALRPAAVEGDALGGEVEEVCTLLERARGVYVVGAAGSGKTRLAEQVAAACSGRRAVLWISLARTDMGAALLALEEELRRRGADPGGGSDPDLAGKAVRLGGFVASALPDALLVFDGLEHVIDQGDLEALGIIARHWTWCRLLLCGRHAPALDIGSGLVGYAPWSSAAARIHQHYVRYWKRRGRPTDLPESLDELPDDLRRSNYETARSIPRALGELGITIHRIGAWAVPRTPDITEAELEALARQEHQRWKLEREESGYTLGEERDPAAKTNPHLVSWEQLPASQRSFTIDAVREWPVILAALGYEVRREQAPDDLADDALIERLARTLHERYVAERVLEGERVADNPALVEYDQLPPELKEANRDSARTIPRKLAQIGVTPQMAVGLELSPAQIEELSRWEHTRWCWQKRLQGWLHGPRDDHARTRPDLVPWSELAEPIRDRDREKIAAIGALLEAASEG